MQTGSNFHRAETLSINNSFTASKANAPEMIDAFQSTLTKRGMPRHVTAYIAVASLLLLLNE
jgi:hypothetical protein